MQLGSEQTSLSSRDVSAEPSELGEQDADEEHTEPEQDVMYFGEDHWPEEPAQGRIPQVVRVQFFSEEPDDRDARFSPSLHEVDLNTFQRSTIFGGDLSTTDEPEGAMTVVLDFGFHEDEPPHRPPRPTHMAHSLRMLRSHVPNKFARAVRDARAAPRSPYPDEVQHGVLANRVLAAVTDAAPKTGSRAGGGGKRPYKPAHLKVKPINAPTPEEYRIIRRFPSDPMLSLPKVPVSAFAWQPTAYLTEERMANFKIDSNPDLWPEEKKLYKYIIANNEEAFAWTEQERRRFRDDYFPPVKIAVLPHVPWTRRHVPIPPSVKDKVIELLNEKIRAGVYEACNSSYRNSWFCVVKKDGQSLRIVHDLQPLNAVTIRDAGLLPQPDEFAEESAGLGFCMGHPWVKII